MTTNAKQVIQQEISAYKASLERWQAEVLGSDRDEEAFRTASNRPAQTGMIPTLDNLVSADREHAEAVVEEHLRKRMNAMDDRRIEQLQGLVRHSLVVGFPRLHAEFEARFRKSA